MDLVNESYREDCNV